ncbi:uncharacterized protein LOC118746487 [Rhagoletis pomonella]|uniref:uncharacterized protein LOC118746487 n=1 Tax=Rhagoletis pomonella TaxID=28610 RepID=UPI0017873AB9|nr:uncharacterized protein LOC118746487 [Rhagoletis pomonella]
MSMGQRLKSLILILLLAVKENSAKPSQIFPAGMVFVKPTHDLEKLSYPVQLLDFCYMVPLPESVSINELFIGIVRLPMLFCIFVFIVIFAALLTHLTHLDKRKQINFINLFLNDQSIRGMLSQSFVIAAKSSVKTKFVVFLLCYMSIITNTTYQAYLQSFLTYPPLLPMHHSYEDLEAAGMTILFAEPDVPIIEGNKNLLEHFHLFKISKYEDWVKLRSRMNTKYVYPITNLRWETIELQQSLFRRPIFYFNSEFCFFRTMSCCLPIRADLPYRDLLDDFVLRLHSSGIMKEWMSMTFLLMPNLKR